MVQYGTVQYAYFFQFKQVLFRAEVYWLGPANPTVLVQHGTVNLIQVYPWSWHENIDNTATSS